MSLTKENMIMSEKFGRDFSQLRILEEMLEALKEERDETVRLRQNTDRMINLLEKVHMLQEDQANKLKEIRNIVSRRSDK